MSYKKKIFEIDDEIEKIYMIINYLLIPELDNEIPKEYYMKQTLVFLKSTLKGIQSMLNEELSEEY